MMASIAKRAGGWRAQVVVKGVRDSGTFSTKAEASAWAAQRETEIRAEKTTGVQRGRTVDDAFRRYEKEVSVHKRGGDKEIIRMNAIGRMVVDDVPLQDWKQAEVTPAVLGKWRDAHLKGTAAKNFADKVLGSSVNRDLNLFSHVFGSAVKEWKWLAKSPTTDVLRPADPPPRDRLYTQDEIDRLCLALGIDSDQVDRVESVSQRVGNAFLFAIETAMRAGEICALIPEYVSGRTSTLPPAITKNGTKRAVPLSKRAVELIQILPAPKEGGTVFGLTAQSLDALFRKAKTRAAIGDATFHDTRHLAITRLAKKLNVLDLARMVGHRDLRQLQVYYNETAEAMAERLD
jgi:integrase